jgi:hypothetical protein
MPHRTKIIWEIAKGEEKLVIADLVSLSLNHDEWDDEKTLLVLLSIDKWYNRLTPKLKQIVDDQQTAKYNILIQEVDGLPI